MNFGFLFISRSRLSSNELEKRSVNRSSFQNLRFFTADYADLADEAGIPPTIRSIRNLRLIDV